MLLSRPTLSALLSSFFVFGVLFPPALQASNAVLNLGTVAVGASATASFSIPLSTAPSGVTLALHYGTDFTIGTCVASGSSCNVSVTFSPTHAGLRQDAIIVKIPPAANWPKVSSMAPVGDHKSHSAPAC